MRRTTSIDPRELETLAARHAQVRKLALAIAREAHVADDLAQDAWVALLRHPPPGPGSLSAWLAGTMRNLLRLRQRSEAHRKQRERAVSRPEHETSSQLAMERLELHQAILQAVRELREPYRTTVILRWFEGLDPQEVAQRTGVPVRTVHTRGTRALRMLRSKLAGKDEGGLAARIVVWMSGLVGPGAPEWKGALAVQTKSKLIAGGALAAMAGVAYLATPSWTGIDAQVRSVGPDLALPQDADLRPLTNVLLVQEPADGRSEVALAAAPAEPEPQTSAARTVFGLAVDELGHPAFGVEIEHVPSGHDPLPPATVSRATNANGRFELSVESQEGLLRAATEGWTTLFTTQVRAPDPEEGYVLVVAKSLPIAGRVVDVAGTPIQGADVTYDRAGVSYLDLGRGDRAAFGPGWARLIFRDPLRAVIPYSLERSEDVDWRTTTDAEGRFRFEDAPHLAESKVVARKEGLLDGSQVLEGRTGEVVIVLQRPTDVPGMLSGRVVDERRRPQSGAVVSYGSSSAWTDDGGRFVLDLRHAAEASRLIAVKEGWEPAVEIRRGSSADSPGAWPTPLELVLRDRAPVFRGRVVGPQGEPRADAQVFLLDPCTHGEVFAWAQETSALDAELMKRAVVGGHPQDTDAEGRFRLDAVLPRAHRIGVSDRSTLAYVETESIAPDSGEILIQLGGEQRITQHEGRVVDFTGRGIAGCKVSLRRTEDGGEHAGARTFEGPSATADDKGRFDLGAASTFADEAFVQVDDQAPWVSVPIPPEADRGALVLRVGLPGRFQLDLTQSPLEVDAFWVLDREGRLLNLAASQGAGWISSSHWSAKSRQQAQALLVAETGVTLVLAWRGREVARTPIRIVPGELVVVRP